MGYLNKNAILKAYKELSHISKDPTLQGATQKVSAIRHFMALDSFYRINERNCDTRDKNDKNEFIQYVGYICDVCLNLYTTNFYIPLKEHSKDFGVGSNFYSAGQVKVSLVNTKEVVDYPKRGGKPLFQIQNGVLIRTPKLYSNFTSYIEHTKFIVALCLWILRKEYIEGTEITYNNIYTALSKLYTKELLSVLVPNTDSFQKELETYDLALNENFYSIRESDITSLFKEQSKDNSSNSVEKFKMEKAKYLSALRTKPFMLLAGISGTGKSRIVREFAFKSCPVELQDADGTEPGNYCMIEVKPNWHDSTELLGYWSNLNKQYMFTKFVKFLIKAKMYPETPFFVCLDEMNLAPVEEYFADFLSVIESRKRRADGKIVTDAIVPASVFNDTEYAADFNIFMKLGLELTDPKWKADELSELSDEDMSHAFVRQDIVEELKRDGLTIPSNVIIIGTVNMDDTTNSFSRKVIDRAMTFETVVGKFGEEYFNSDVALNYVKNPLNGELFLSDEVRATQMIDEGRFILTKEEQTKILNFINDINEDLDGSPFKISYRILNETILLYRSKKRIAEIMKDEDGLADGVEFKTDLNTIFDDILMQKVLPRIEGDYEKCSKCLNKLSLRADNNEWLRSYKKIEFMIKRFGSDRSGFTSFWN